MADTASTGFLHSCQSVARHDGRKKTRPKCIKETRKQLGANGVGLRVKRRLDALSSVEVQTFLI